MAVIDRERSALRLLERYVAATARAQWGDPTPCEGWDVRTLLNHVIGGNRLYRAGFAGTATEGDWSLRDGPQFESDPAGSYAASAAELLATVEAPGVLAQAVHMPFGTVPGESALAVHFVDTLVHAWDLAVAIGAPPALDDGDCTAALAVVAHYPEDSWGDRRFFAPKLESADASPADRLIATTGRDPAWAPPARSGATGGAGATGTA